MDLGELEARVGHGVRVAVARFDGLGDWIMTLPLIEALDKHPSVACVTQIAPGPVARLLASGDASRAISPDLALPAADPASWNARWRERSLAAAPGQIAAFRDGRRHRGQLDLVVLPRWESDIGFNTRSWAAGTGALLAGHDPKARPGVLLAERGEAAGLSLAMSDDRVSVHEIERNLALGAALGVDVGPFAGVGRRYFGTRNLARPRSVALHTGASREQRRWPVARWTQLIHFLVGLGYERLILVGGPEDDGTHQELQRVFPWATSTSRSRIEDLPETLAGTSMFVGGDSGPAHLASSLDVPTVVVSPHPLGARPGHPSDPARVAPAGRWTAVLRPVEPAASECRDGCVAVPAHCILGVGAEAVAMAVSELKLECDRDRGEDPVHD